MGQAAIEIKVQNAGNELTNGQYSQTANEIIATECLKIMSYSVIREVAMSLNIIPEDSPGNKYSTDLMNFQRNISVNRIIYSSISALIIHSVCPSSRVCFITL